MSKLLSVLLVLCLSPLWADTSSCELHTCIAVVDAGSTGTRLHVYAYDLDTSLTPIHIQELYSQKITPGLATLSPNASTIDAYLLSLSSAAPRGKMPVYFYATAGMRFMSNAKQDDYYNLISNWMKTKPEWHLIEAKTISGQEEGIYGWLSVNYTLGTLQSADKTPVGVMDMGGASVQISFPTQHEDNLAVEDVTELDVYGRHISLFSHSFLGLGQTEVMHQYLNEPSCFSTAYLLPSGFLGTGDGYKCAERVSLLLNVVHKVKDMIQPVLRENPVSDWYAMGGLGYLASEQPFTFKNAALTNHELMTQANDLACNGDSQGISRLIVQNDRAYGYCLIASYYYALMSKAYGISEDAAIHYLDPTEGADWTLGVVLHQSGK